MSSTACTTSGVSSLSARPISSAARDSGVARIRSNAPVMISNCRFEPVMLVPNMRDHHDHAGQEPLQRAAAAERPRAAGRPRRAADRTGRGRPAAAAARRPARTGPGRWSASPGSRPRDVGGRLRGCSRRRAAGEGGGGHRLSAPSRRLRPVRLRKTSSSVGWCSVAARTSTPRRRPARASTAGSSAARPARSTRNDSSTSGPGASRSSAARCRAGRRPPAGGLLRVRRGTVHGDPVAGQVGLQHGRGVVGDDPPVVDHDHPLGHRVGLLEVVRGQHDRGAVLGRAAG